MVGQLGIADLRNWPIRIPSTNLTQGCPLDRIGSWELLELVWSEFQAARPWVCLRHSPASSKVRISRLLGGFDGFPERRMLNEKSGVLPPRETVRSPLGFQKTFSLLSESLSLE